MAFINSTAATIFGTSNADEIYTNSLNGSFSTIYGGLGNDIYFIDAFYNDVTDTPADVVVEALGGGLDTIRLNMQGNGGYGNNSFTLYDNVENLEASLFTSVYNNFTLTGNNLANKISITSSTASTHAFLNGLAGNDTLIGGFARDTLNGGTGADSMVGGVGSDTYYVDNVLDIVVENDGYGFDTVNSSVSFTLGANIEKLRLDYSAGNLNGTGNASNNDLYGSSGNNTLNGLAGNDNLYGNAGNDILNGGDGSDNLYGGDGLDTLNGGAGNDYLYGNSGNDILNGGDGDDYFEGNDGNDTLNGDAGNDELDGNDGNDILNGGAGDDDLNGGYGSDTLNGGAGNDELDGNFNSTFIDKLDGGAGDDFYRIYSANDVVADTGVAGNDTVRAYVQLNGDLGAGIENLELSNYGGIVTGRGNALDNYILGNNSNNILFGLAGNDLIDGGFGNDALIGDIGNDTLVGGFGNDLLNGGTGNDTYVVDSTSDAVIETTAGAAGGVDIVFSEVTFTLASNLAGNHVTNVENLTLTGAAAINGTGNLLANIIIGGSGINSISGGDGNDTLNGGTGIDTMNGGAGNDVFIVDNTDDVVQESAGLGSGTDRVESSATFTLSDNVETLKLTGTNDIYGYGNALANTITGNNGNNYLNGNLGADTMTGGLGNDRYVVDTGDIVTELAGQGYDTVYSYRGSYTLDADVEALHLSDPAAISGTGNAIDNYIYGNSIANTLSGAAGNDSLYGYGGNDTLNGDIGNDYLSGADNNDTLNGGIGNDTLNGGTGADSMTGGLGNDTYYMDNAGDVITENAAAGTDRLIYQLAAVLDLSTLSLANIDNAELDLLGTDIIGNDLNNVLDGNSGDNNITGGDGDDTLNGNFGVDILNGGDGNDTLNGGIGIDSMIGGAGNDVFIVGNSNDDVQEGITGGIDRVESSVNYELDQGNRLEVENITLTGNNNIYADGNALNNMMIGNIGHNDMWGYGGNDTLDGGLGDDDLNGGSGADSLIGGAGDDDLNGEAGADRMEGGLGDDFYYLDVAGDQVIELAGQGTDSVVYYGAGLYTLGGTVENLYLSGLSTNGTGNALNNIINGNNGANSLNGFAGNDELFGADGADALIGGLGLDTLDGGAGTDTLTGGADHDVFVKSNDLSIDTITDYVVGIDITYLIGFAGLNFTGAGTSIVASQFQLGAADDVNDRIIYDQTNGNLYYDADGSGAGAQQFILDFTGVAPALSSTDIFGPGG